MSLTNGVFTQTACSNSWPNSRAWKHSYSMGVPPFVSPKPSQSSQIWDFWMPIVWEGANHYRFARTPVGEGEGPEVGLPQFTLWYRERGRLGNVSLRCSAVLSKTSFVQDRIEPNQKLPTDCSKDQEQQQQRALRCHYEQTPPSRLGRLWHGWDDVRQKLELKENLWRSEGSRSDENFVVRRF